MENNFYNITIVLIDQEYKCLLVKDNKTQVKSFPEIDVKTIVKTMSNSKSLPIIKEEFEKKYESKLPSIIDFDIFLYIKNSIFIANCNKFSDLKSEKSNYELVDFDDLINNYETHILTKKYMSDALKTFLSCDSQLFFSDNDNAKLGQEL